MSSMGYNYKRKIIYRQKPKTKVRINKNLSCKSKNIVYIIECYKCKKVYIGSTQTLNTRIALHKSNIKLPENRKLDIS